MYQLLTAKPGITRGSSSHQHGWPVNFNSAVQFIVLSVDSYEFLMCLSKPSSRFYSQLFLFLMLLYCLYCQGHNGKAVYSAFLSNKLKHITKHLKG